MEKLVKFAAKRLCMCGELFDHAGETEDRCDACIEHAEFCEDGKCTRCPMPDARLIGEK